MNDWAVIGSTVAAALGLRELLAYVTKRFSETRKYEAEARVIEAEAHEREQKNLTAHTGSMMDIQTALFNQMRAVISRVTIWAEERIAKCEKRLEVCETGRHDCEQRCKDLLDRIERLT